MTTQQQIELELERINLVDAALDSALTRGAYVRQHARQQAELITAEVRVYLDKKQKSIDLLRHLRNLKEDEQ